LVLTIWYASRGHRCGFCKKVKLWIQKRFHLILISRFHLVEAIVDKSDEVRIGCADDRRRINRVTRMMRFVPQRILWSFGTSRCRWEGGSPYHYPMVLGSTAGCGKPHVRWCGRGDGRNPVTPSRSLLYSIEMGGQKSLAHLAMVFYEKGR